LKKVLCLTFAFLLLLSGCQKGAITPICENLGFNAHISYFNEKYICPTVISSDGTMTVKVTEPEILNGLTLTYTNDGNVTATLGSVTYTPSAQSSYYVGITDCMAAAFREIKGQTIENKGDTFVFEGNFNSKPYRIYFTDKGIPLKMETGDIKIEFCDISVF